MKNKYLKLIIIQAIMLTIMLFTVIIVKTSYINLMPDCFFKNNFNINCFSCGGTRCMMSICDLNFITAFKYNPFIFILICYLILFDAIYILNTILDKQYLKFIYLKWWYVIIFVVLWLGYTIFINIY